METEDKVVKCPQCGAEIEANAKFCKILRVQTVVISGKAEIIIVCEEK